MSFEPGGGGAAVWGYDREGKLVRGLDPNRRYHAGAFCKLVWHPAPDVIAFDRAEYMVWHRGLVDLVERLRGAGMSEHEATPPVAPARPWEAGQAPAGRLLQALDRVPVTPAPAKRAARVVKKSTRALSGVA